MVYYQKNYVLNIPKHNEKVDVRDRILLDCCNNMVTILVQSVLFQNSSILRVETMRIYYYVNERNRVTDVNLAPGKTLTV